MQQLTQKLKNGSMEILEVPLPIINENQILVRTNYSVISPGTEGKTVLDARKGYFAKAKSRKKELLQVVESIKSLGFKQTYDIVMNKLEAPSPLGYSCAGEVLSIGDNVKKFKVGDKIASGGQGAFHSEIVAVYENLSVKVPSNVSLKEAAFTTIASIAIQGIRQSKVSFGESCLVIGLGLIGQLTMELLQAFGISPIGIDIEERKVQSAINKGYKHCYNRFNIAIKEIILNMTCGYGVDAVIITAGTSSLDPVNFAGEIARKKARIVIVGAVPTGFDRSNYYRKELELVMSCSYGPGRYDSNYEEKGISYPVGYVRFTENHNMQTYINLLSEKKININKFISHEFELLESPQAYNLITSQNEEFSGIIIKYDLEKEVKKSINFVVKLTEKPMPNIGFIGAGSFAQNTLLPNLVGLVSFDTIATANGNNSVYVSKKYGFRCSTSDTDEIFDNCQIDSVFVVTRHDTHAKYVLKGLDSLKNIFVEKPLALTLEELDLIKDKYYSLPIKPILMVGYNRRFSPLITEVKQYLRDDVAKSILIRVNAGILPTEHWVNDSSIGGGRLIGEGCHFVDLALYLAGSKIISIFASEMRDENNLTNSVSINLIFSNGSIATILYLSNGNKKLPKEYLEIFYCGTSFVINDFRELYIYTKKSKVIKLKEQDKGHKNELVSFVNSLKTGKMEMSFSDVYMSSLITFKILESIREGRKIDI